MGKEDDEKLPETSIEACPKPPSPQGFGKITSLLFIHISMFRVRLVQVGLIIGVSLQAVTTAYITPMFIAIVERFIELQGSLPSEEAMSVLIPMFSLGMLVLFVLFVSSAIVGYTTGKVSAKLRYGMILGVTNLLLGHLVGAIIGFFYTSSFYVMYANFVNLGLVQSISTVDIVVSGIRTYLSLLALGGGGGVIGQLLSQHFGRKRQPRKAHVLSS